MITEPQDAMTDIVERLRLMGGPRECWEAADEIERQRSEVAKWRAAYNASRENEERLRGLLQEWLEAWPRHDFGTLRARTEQVTLGVTTDQPSLSQRMADAGYTKRDNRLVCDECGESFTLQMLPIHDCTINKSQACACNDPDPAECCWNDGGVRCRCTCHVITDKSDQ
jgi:hypothetical protein